MLVLIYIVSLFLLVGLGFYVFVADPRSRAHQTFATFIAFLALWITKDMIFWNFFPVDEAAGWWASVSFVIALLMQFAMVVFAWVFPEGSRTPRKRAAILFAPAIVLVPAAFSGLLWTRIGFDTGRFAIELTPLAYAFVAYVYFVFVYAARVLWQKYTSYRGTQAGQQVGAILWSLIITGTLKTVANLVFPYFGRYDLLPLSALFILPGVVVYAYAILNFKLFSLQTALNQFRLFPIAYKVALSIASVAVLSFVIFQVPIVYLAFRNGMDEEAWRRYLVFSIITAMIPNLVLVLLVLRILSRPIQRITLAAIAVTKGGYGTRVDMRKTNDEIGLLAESFNEMSRKMAADIEQLKRLNDQLIRTEKLAAMGTLAAGVAHEVNNPLASISSIVQIMRKESGHSDETRERLGLISAQIERIKQVTGDMTDLARSKPAARSTLNVNDVVETAIRLATFDRAFQKITLIRRMGAGLPEIVADEDQLQQVFLNLLLNARDAMPDGGTLEISSYSDEESVVLEFADDGAGIANEMSGRVFDPFFTTKPAGKGTGLGLAVCYGIVTAHGGSIELHSNEPEGAVFRVKLPFA
ncbi:MAG: HAMP domain-containing protein [Acidobacteria bacterium]|nr:HAMP domain-containing protein [Acidobacteriota bacterium]MCW5949333.1 HAMP domain-containing protein [Pyrinomonadaceae bacterium]